MKTNYTILHNPTQSRFEVTIEAHTAVLEYILSGESITFTHTIVPAALEGRGIGSALAKDALAYAREKKLQITSRCWFVDKYMQRHPNE